MKRCRPESLSLPLELQLLRGICGLGAMFFWGSLLSMTPTDALTSQPSSPEYWLPPLSFFPFSFSSHSGWGGWGGKKKSDAHLLPQPPAHLSFKRRKPCRLLWTLRRLNSFKISFNYRPPGGCRNIFFFELAIIAFVGSSIIRTWRYMKNLCPSRQEKHASEREREEEKAKRFLDDNSRRSQKTLQGDWWIRKFQGCAVWTGVLATKLRFCVP